MTHVLRGFLIDAKHQVTLSRNYRIFCAINLGVSEHSCNWIWHGKADKAIRRHSAQNSASARKEIIFAASRSAHNATPRLPRLAGVNADTCRVARAFTDESEGHRGGRDDRRGEQRRCVNSQFARWHLNDGRDSNRRRDIESFNITRVEDTAGGVSTYRMITVGWLLIGVIERPCRDRRKAERSG